MFWIKTENLEVRTKLLEKLKQEKILAAFHYVPLHSSDAGKMFGYFFGEDKYTTKESNRLIRLPMYYDIDREYVEKVVDVIKKFYENE